MQFAQNCAGGGVLELALSKQEFCEDCEGQKQTIQRSPSLQSNAALPAAFERVTGDLIYDGLCNGFRV